jgi:protease IV
LGDFSYPLIPAILEEGAINQMEEPFTASNKPAPEPRIDRESRTVMWVLLSVSLGFLLPVCSCALLLASSFFSLSLLDSSPGSRRGGAGDAVAIVRVEGPISSGDEEEFAPGAVSGVVLSDLRQAAEDESVKAVVLRVDSPGGTVTGSAQIYEAIRDFEKPVVVSMASTAASGGYYVSAPADYIIARPDTLTGSIGVIFTIFDAQELLDNIGVEVISITSGRNKSIASPWEELTDEQREILETLVEENYNEFVRVIVEGRNLTDAEVRALADGRIYSGRQALVLNLVDELGDLRDAINKAAELGGIVGEPRIIEYEHTPSLRHLLGGFNARLQQTQSREILNLIYEFTTPTLEYRYVAPIQ